MDSEYYKLFNDDLSNLSDLELLIHFINNGKNEDRIYNYKSFLDKHLDFDYDLYKICNNDLDFLSKAELCLYFHKNRDTENRIFNIDSFYNFYDEFDIEVYIKYNSDMHNKSIKDVIYHYIKYGQYENRIHNYLYFILINFPDFDIYYYSKHNCDLINFKKIDYYKHFYIHGRNENRIYSKDSLTNITLYSNFDSQAYKIFNLDLNNLNNTDLKIHFDNHGKNENRIYNNYLFIKKYPNFNLDFYKNFNKDLIFDIDQEYFSHFHNYGYIKNKEYFKIDFDTVNLNKDILDINLKNKIYNHSLIRNITNYYELYEYNIQYQKPFYIYNKKSFYEYYPDFDLEFYKNKYFFSSKENIKDIDVMAYYHLDGKYKKHLINNKKKIIIYTPPFDIKCGGIVVMHYLAKIINEYNPARFYCKLFIFNNLRYNNIFCNDFARMDEIDDNTVIIYPEIISGNPLACKNVVRWILLALGIEMPIDHSKNWDSTDIIYHWEPKSSDLNKMTCHYLNPIFKNTNNNIRYKTCYLIKKGRLIHFNINYFHPSDSINIDNFSLEEMTNIFNQCKYFYSYDPKSMYIIYALICGCTPIIYPLENISKEDYFKTTIFYKNNTIYTKGISYGNSEEEVNYAVNTMNEGLNDLNLIFNTERNTVYKFLNNI
jgi:hypothetical protein